MRSPRTTIKTQHRQKKKKKERKKETVQMVVQWLGLHAFAASSVLASELMGEQTVFTADISLVSCWGQRGQQRPGHHRHKTSRPSTSRVNSTCPHTHGLWYTVLVSAQEEPGKIGESLGKGSKNHHQSQKAFISGSITTLRHSQGEGSRGALKNKSILILTKIMKYMFSQIAGD